ncbi:MAG: hypothetical protein MJ072_02495, partial [Clostridia bacterium]|nr:hypothetical protein [Clostridia bacterium]
MKLEETVFKRKFSMNPFKSLHLNTGKMDFSFDFINTDIGRGDKYPLLESDGEYKETISGNTYSFDGENARVSRLIGQFFPTTTYEIVFSSLSGDCGFTFTTPNETYRIFLRVNDGKTYYVFENSDKTQEIAEFDGVFKEGTSLVVSTGGSSLAFYLKNNGAPVFVKRFIATVKEELNYYKIFDNSTVALTLSGKAVIKEVLAYIDSGVMQADMRTIRYENGDVMYENGKVYFTMSLRQHAGGGQGVISWVPGTTEFQLVGQIFYDIGDGKWCSDVASSIIYNRKNSTWYVWYCSFSHGHVLAHSAFKGDPRFGITVIDSTLMPEDKEAPRSAFVGKSADEDPDFFYDEVKGVWRMCICRSGENGNYQYHFFESDKPFSDYKLVGLGVPGGGETGGS